MAKTHGQHGLFISGLRLTPNLKILSSSRLWIALIPEMPFFAITKTWAWTGCFPWKLGIWECHYVPGCVWSSCSPSLPCVVDALHSVLFMLLSEILLLYALETVQFQCSLVFSNTHLCSLLSLYVTKPWDDYKWTLCIYFKHMSSIPLTL